MTIAHCQNENKLLLNCIDMKKTPVPPITFFIELIEHFNYKRLSLGCLYELKCKHAVLGHLQHHKENYLAFIQLPSQYYGRHKKLPEIFRVSSLNLPENMQEYSSFSLSIYCLIEQKEVYKIVFLYISPA